MNVVLLVLATIVGWVVIGLLTCYISLLAKKSSETFETVLFWPVIWICFIIYACLNVLQYIGGLCGMETDSIKKEIKSMYE